jgi:gliding motility-associated transport system ATP-binding protein
VTDATDDDKPEEEAAETAETSETVADKPAETSADGEGSPDAEAEELSAEEALAAEKALAAEEALAAEKALAAEEALEAEKAFAAEEALEAEKALAAEEAREAEEDEPAASEEEPAAKEDEPAVSEEEPAAKEEEPVAKEPEYAPPNRDGYAADSLHAATGEVLIEAENLSKYYGQFTAVENVSFEVRRGQVVAFLGPNGAGKSTTMKLLTGVLSPDRGQARIAGLSVAHNRIEIAHKLGYLPETGPLYQEMTPIELLRFFGEARGLTRKRCDERIRALVKRLDLESVRGKAIAKLSKGYRQRVGLAQSLLHEPDVLIMDEPTSGLDPNQIRDVRRIIREFAQDKAILLSTHILQEVEAVADRVVFISRGRIVFQGDVQTLLQEGEGSLDAAFARYTGVRYEEVSA